MDTFEKVSARAQLTAKYRAMTKIKSHNIACICSLICFSISITLLVLYIHFAGKIERNYIFIELSIFALALSFIIYVIKTNIKKDNQRIHPVSKV